MQIDYILNQWKYGETENQACSVKAVHLHGMLG
jgi:hypothetical protein